MPVLNIDLSAVEEFDPLPVGNYPIVVEKVELRSSKADAESQYLNWSLAITDDEFEGRKLFFMTSLKPKALWRLKAVLKALGMVVDTLDLSVDDETNLVLQPELTGLVGLAVVKNEVYEGRLRDKVDDILPYEDAQRPVAAPVAVAPAPAPVRPAAAPARPVAAPVRQGPPPVATRSAVATAGRPVAK